MVFSAEQKNQRSLYVRPLDQPTAAVMPGTTGGTGPFFSPDGQWVGYWSAGQLRKVPLAGGPPVAVLSMPEVFGASWGDNDRIVFARGAGGLQDVPSSGGSAAELTKPNRGEVSHRLPHVLPGGDAVLYTVTKTGFPRWDESEVWVYSRAAGTSKRLIEGGADARYVSSGHLVYAREGVMLAVPFDLATARSDRWSGWRPARRHAGGIHGRRTRRDRRRAGGRVRDRHAGLHHRRREPES